MSRETNLALLLLLLGCMLLLFQCRSVHVLLLLGPVKLFQLLTLLLRLTLRKT